MLVVPSDRVLHGAPVGHKPKGRCGLIVASGPSTFVVALETARLVSHSRARQIPSVSRYRKHDNRAGPWARHDRAPTRHLARSCSGMPAHRRCAIADRIAARQDHLISSCATAVTPAAIRDSELENHHSGMAQNDRATSNSVKKRALALWRRDALNPHWAHRCLDRVFKRFVQPLVLPQLCSANGASRSPSLRCGCLAFSPLVAGSLLCGLA